MTSTATTGLSAADNDNEVTIIDATGIQRYLAGLSHSIGIGAFG